MGYFYLFLSVFASLIKGYCGKKCSAYVRITKDVFFMNSLRMLLCVMISFILMILAGDVSTLRVSYDVLFIAMLSGITTAAFIVLWITSVQRGAYMMLDVFLMLGNIIPIYASAVLFHERIGINHIIGFVMLVTAVIVMCSYNNSIKNKMTLFSFLLLILCSVANGLTDLLQKLFVSLYSDVGMVAFNFYTYVSASIVLLICYSVCKSNSGKSEIWTRNVGGYVVIMSICLFANAYLKMLATKILDAVVLYPLYQGASIIFSVIMAAVFFNERITSKAICGITIAFIGLVSINLH